MRISYRIDFLGISDDYYNFYIAAAYVIYDILCTLTARELKLEVDEIPNYESLYRNKWNFMVKKITWGPILLTWTNFNRSMD